jgi:hypothetical protein
MASLGTETNPIPLVVGDNHPGAVRTVTNDDGDPWYLSTDQVSVDHVYADGTEDTAVVVGQGDPTTGEMTVPAPTTVDRALGLVRSTVTRTGTNGDVESLPDRIYWTIGTA